MYIRFFIYLNLSKIWYIDMYIDVYNHKFFQTCSIQIDLGTCFNREYMSFAFIKLYNYNIV